MPDAAEQESADEAQAIGTAAQRVPVPPLAGTTFQDGIDHPALWLWDAWTHEHAGTLHLFTLAVARRDLAGLPITPATRDAYPFHVRRFASTDGGASWRDEGAYMLPPAGAGANVWSGSALPHGDVLLFGYTQVRAPSAERRYVQAICLTEASPDGAPPASGRAVVLSDPERDRDAIEAMGYYLGPASTLGGPSEEGGPLLAWRDPFLLAEPSGGVRAYWSAKVAPDRPAIAHARLACGPDGWTLGELLAPMTLPDADAFTQAEVPKVYAEPDGTGYLLLVSACDRRSEAQPLAEVTKAMRLYRGPSPDGPWAPHAPGSSLVADAQGLFGGALTEVGAGEATLLAPYADAAPRGRALTFAAPRRIATGPR